MSDIKTFHVVIKCHDAERKPIGKEIHDDIPAHSEDMAHGMALAKHGYPVDSDVTVTEKI